MREREEAWMGGKEGIGWTLVADLGKWGSLVVDCACETSVGLAYYRIVFTKILNVNAWKKLSDDPTKKADSLL